MAESTPAAKSWSSADYEELEGEYEASQQHLQSKEQALRILQGQLKKADIISQRLKQEMKQLRSQLSRTQQISSPSTTTPRPPHNSGSISMSINEDLIKEKEVLIQELEKAQWQISELERCIEQLKDEKEELANEKTHFSIKCEGLVKCLEEERKRQSPCQSAVERVVEENRRLQLALVEAKAERERLRSRVERYKSAIDRRKSREAAAELVENLPDAKQDTKLAAKRIAELESLANNLSQSVKVKSVTITHKRKANKMLATKLAELEHQVNMREVSCMKCTCMCKEMAAETDVQSSGDEKSINRKSTNDSCDMYDATPADRK